MSLGGDIAAALPQLRAEAESMMVDTLRAENPLGTQSMDPDTLEMTDDFETAYEGKGRIQRPGNQPAQTVAGEVEFGVGTVFAQLPLSASGIKRNARVTVLAIGDTTDPDLLGLVATVQANLTKTHPTKRTLVCEEVT